MKKIVEQVCSFYDGHRKKLLIMRNAVLILLISAFQVFATGSYSQTAQLSLKMKDATIKEVLTEIENQSEFYFLYNSELIDVTRKVDISVKNEKVNDVLSRLFSDNEVNVSISDRHIVLTPVTEMSFTQQQKSVSGKVTDTGDQPLPGVTVLIKGSTQGTVTNMDGNYSIANIPEDATLVFSFVGMLTREIKVGNQSNINVQMVADAIGIEEVVAIGYGTVKKKDLTGSVARVNQEVFESRPVTTLTDALRGGVTGLNIGYSTSPKGGGSIEVRGQTSLKANNSPLIVVDGVIYNGDISDINPMDIANIDVLKDASSAAIYGARSASGVIMITTKKGKSPKPTINFSSTVGVTQLANEIPIWNPEEYLIAKRDNLYRNNAQAEEGYYHNPDNLPPGVSLEQWRGYVPTPNQDNEAEWLNRMTLTPIEQQNYLTGNTVNMMDLIRQTGIRQDYNVSISANTDLIKYYWSLGYVDNEGTTIGDEYKNIRSRLNIETKVTDYLKVGVNSQLANSNEGFVPRDALRGAWRNFESPYGSLYNEDGTLKIDMDDNGQGPRNPLRSDLVEKLYEAFNFSANLYAQLDLPYGFSYEFKYYNRRNNIKDYQFYPEEVDPGIYKGGSASRSEYNSVESSIDNLLYWNFDKGVHNINVTLLANAEKFKSYQSTQSNKDFSPNALLGYHNLGIGSTPVIGTNDEKQTADALMGRVNYSLMDRYIFMASVRRDGYSAFGQENPRHIFPATSFGWTISEEDFFKVNFVDYLKLRLSWGVNGNRDIGRYSALARMGTLKYLEGDHETVIGLGLNSMPNSKLQWESTEAFNIGFDFALFEEKLFGSLEYYDMSSTNQLLTRTLPVLTGYSSVVANLGQVDNHGFEATLNWTNLEKNKFKWNSYFTASMNRNEIVHLYGDMEDVLDEDGNVIGQKELDDESSGWYIGHAIDAIYDYNRLGIYQTDEAELATIYGRQSGDVKFEDVNNDESIDATNDREFLGHTEPRLRLGMRNEISFLDNFDLSFYMYAQLGQMATENIRTETGAMSGNFYNIPYWTPDNITNDFPMIASARSVNWWNKSSFLRMQNITLGYNLPASLVNKIGISKFRAYLNFDNVFVISNYYKYDPETHRPTPRNISLGFNLTL